MHRIVTVLVSLCTLIVIVLGGLLVWGWAPDLPRERVIAEYTDETSEFLDLPSGITVHVRDQGCGTCEVVMLVHGSNSSLHTWEPWAAVLGERWRVLSVDMPGHGLTGRTADDDYSIARAAAVVEEVRAAKDVAAMHLAGNSRGGAISLFYAVEHPDRVSSLALLNSAGAPWPGYAEDHETPVVYQLAEHPVTRPLLMNFLPRSFVAQAVESAFADPAALTEEMVDRYHDLMRFPGNRRATVIRQGLSYPLEPYHQAGTLDMPVLLVWGDQDRIVPVTQLDRFREVLPRAEVIVYEDVGHTPMEEIPARSAADYERFLRDAGSGPSPGTGD